MSKLIFSCFFLSLITFCFGWSQEPHMLVAEIAKMQLQVDNSVALEKATKAIVSWQNDFPIASDFDDAAVWGDDLKSYFNAFDSWHYINRPYTPTNIPVPPQPTENVVWITGQIISTFKNKGNNTSVAWAKTLMLRLLIHMVGDMHQPMHAATLFDERFPQGDKGGNSFTVYNGKTKTNLHSVWDQALGLYSTSYKRPLSNTDLQTLKNKATAIMNLYPIGSFDRNLIQNENFDSWSTDAFHLAIKYAYLNGSLVVGSTLDESYFSNGRPICQSQIALAGYRIAYLIGKYPFDVFELPSPNPSPISMSNPEGMSNSTIIAIAGSSLAGAFLFGAFVSFCIIKLRNKKHSYQRLSN